MDDKVEELAARLMEWIPRLMGYIRSKMRQHRRPDLSLAEFRTLLFFRRHPRSSLSALADHHGLSLATASRMVDNLVRRGLIVRESGLEDRRQIELYLSRQGMKLLTSVEKATLKNLKEHLTDLSPEEIQKIDEGFRLLLETLVSPKGSVELQKEKRVSRPGPKRGPKGRPL
jgi:DNA-binding MarR family transcriptional regulator